MNVDGRRLRTIWVDREDPETVWIIDQSALPFHMQVSPIRSVTEMVDAIASMRLRGAGCIGAAGAFGMLLAACQAERAGASAGDRVIEDAATALSSSRPTAINLTWAVRRMLAVLRPAAPEDRRMLALDEAVRIADEDVDRCTRIGEHGLTILRQIHQRTGTTVNVLTHCNAGWLAFVDRGTATAPIYAARDAGLPVHVWVDETRPRYQGARLTAWELRQADVPHTVIVDSAAGHVMQRGLVDIVLVGSDRTSANGDVANKIGTYQKALAAADNGLPFYAAMPSSTIDWLSRDGIADTPIEQRDPREVTHVIGLAGDAITEVQVGASGNEAANFAFDVTPARLVTGLITERGVCAASEVGLVGLYPEHGPGGNP